MYYSVFLLALAGIIAPSICQNSELKTSEDGDGVDLYVSGQKVTPDDSCVKGQESFTDEYKWKCYTHCLYLGYGRGWCFAEGGAEKETCKCEDSANYAKESYKKQHSGKQEAGGDKKEQAEEPAADNGLPPEDPINKDNGGSEDAANKEAGDNAGAVQEDAGAVQEDAAEEADDDSDDDSDDDDDDDDDDEVSDDDEDTDDEEKEPKK